MIYIDIILQTLIQWARIIEECALAVLTVACGVLTIWVIWAIFL